MAKKSLPFHASRLLRNLVDEPDRKNRKKNIVSFIAAMQALGITSVFDIVRQPKSQFVERLGEVSDADGSQAYDNAMCYAVQIGRLYRNHRTSSGQVQNLTRRTGIRALTEIGPSYPNLFPEQWDSFTKIGAISASDSPVAYLSHLYYLATKVLEVEGQGTPGAKKIKLEARRPDIAELIIDQQSTFTPRPMLELANEVLQALIKRYLHGTPEQNTPVYEVLANRRHPFIFPYDFAHHQCRLGLSGKKPELGELSYRMSRLLPHSQRPANDYGWVGSATVEAQRLLSGLSPKQQELLIEPSLFTTFYLDKLQLTGTWQGPETSYLFPHQAQKLGFLILSGQPAIGTVNPSASTFTSNSNLAVTATVNCTKPPNVAKTVQLSLRSSSPRYSGNWSINYLHGNANALTLIPTIVLPAGVSLPIDPGYQAKFTLTTANGTVAAPIPLATLGFTLVLDETFTLSSDQQGFFKNSYGLPAEPTSADALMELGTFMAKTGLNAEQVEELLSQRTHLPKRSPNCPTTNPQIALSSNARLYGACYVNGHGSDRYDTAQPATTASMKVDQCNNALGLKEVTSPIGADPDVKKHVWYLTKTSLNRFDRLQRKIRLQRWTGIPSAELDTLLISAIRSEGRNNPGMDLNVNTLRVLGVYRYLSKRYTIKPEEFAALLHNLTPFATGDRVPLFDQVFNTPVLFDTPLHLDQMAFTISNPDPAAKKTLAQLCAGLGLQPTSESLLRLAAQTQAYVGALKRDLATVSSIYRQARVARLFGLSVEESWGLVDLLGGSEYQRLLCRGTLATTSDSAFQSVVLQAGIRGTSLQLVVRVDPSLPGDTLLLEAGSGLVVAGNDFMTSDPKRLFAFVPPANPVTGFLKNADGTDLTLEPFGVGMPFQNKRITRAAWQQMISGVPVTLRVKCGDLPYRDFTVQDIHYQYVAYSTPDILDVLMQMDWAVSFLKDTRQRVGEVRRLLGLERGDYLPRTSLIDRVGQLLEAARGAVVTDEQILALNLPAGSINWREVLLPLLDAKGLITPLPIQLFENTLAQLREGLWLVLNPLSLPPLVKVQCVEKLENLLLAAHDRQLRVIEGVAQEMVNLPMDRAQVVVRWAQTTVHGLLSAVLQLEAASDAVAASSTLLEQLQRVMRYAESALHLRLSTAAMRLFLARPEWLGGTLDSNLVLSLQTFYLLDRYSDWFHGQSQSEEALLGYFILANPEQAQLKNKTLRNAVNDEAALAMATLLGWNKEEIKVLFEIFPQKRACTMADIDWLLRCKKASADSGLAAADLLRATTLNARSPSADWRVVGEAAMAASR